MTEIKDESSQGAGITLAELMTPDMANLYGKIHGGVILSMMDKAAFVCALRYCGMSCVTASVQHFDFLSPIEVGEVVTFFARVDYVGTTSMEISIRILAENAMTRQSRLVNTCYVTMVAIKDGKPSAVPPLKPETVEEKKAYMEALVRKKLRKKQSEEVAHYLKEMEKVKPERLEEWLKEQNLK